MNPYLEQSIKLILPNNIELSEFIDGELEKNPFLEGQDGVLEESKAYGGATEGDLIDGETRD